MIKWFGGMLRARRTSPKTPWVPSRYLVASCTPSDMYLRIHTCIHAYIHTYIRTYIHTYIPSSKYILTSVYRIVFMESGLGSLCQNSDRGYSFESKAYLFVNMEWRNRSYCRGQGSANGSKGLCRSYGLHKGVQSIPPFPTNNLYGSDGKGGAILDSRIYLEV